MKAKVCQNGPLSNLTRGIPVRTVEAFVGKIKRDLDLTYNRVMRPNEERPYPPSTPGETLQLWNTDMRRAYKMHYDQLTQAEAVAKLTFDAIIDQIASKDNEKMQAVLCRAIAGDPTEVVMVTKEGQFVTWNVEEGVEPALAEPASFLKQMDVYIDKRLTKIGADRSRRRSGDKRSRDSSSMSRAHSSSSLNKGGQN